MTLPPVIRIFFAIDLPSTIKEQLASFIVTLKKKSKTHAIRWTKAENLHITLHFLAKVQLEHLPKMIENVHKQISEIDLGSVVTIGTLHLFPNPYRPRVIVLDLKPQDHLASIARLIGQGISASNYEIESRPYRGHLTLGRIKQPHGINLNFLAECKLPETEKIKINEIVLFRSEPQSDGSKYTALEKFTSGMFVG